jgi:hypothetical protein
MEQTGKRVEVHFTRVYLQVEHVCPYCANVFQGSKTKVYCSTICANRAAWNRNGARYLTNKRQQKEAETK